MTQDQNFPKKKVNYTQNTTNPPLGAAGETDINAGDDKHLIQLPRH